MPDRRNYDRRRKVAPPDPNYTGVNDRRREERRESPRAPMFFLLRDANQDGASWLEGQGNLSTGGILWSGKTPPTRRLVDLRFRLPGVPREFRVQGEIIRVGGHNGSSRFHVRFTELDVQSELAIARYLDEMFFDTDSR